MSETALHPTSPKRSGKEEKSGEPQKKQKLLASPESPPPPEEPEAGAGAGAPSGGGGKCKATAADKGKGKMVVEDYDEDAQEDSSEENSSDENSSDGEEVVEDEDNEYVEDPLHELDPSNILPPTTRRRPEPLPGSLVISDLEEDDEEDDEDVVLEVDSDDSD